MQYRLFDLSSLQQQLGVAQLLASVEAELL